MSRSNGFRLGIDFGTSQTAAVLQRPDGRVDSLLFDGSPSLPSAVFAAPNGEIMVGRDAIHHAQVDPSCYEPHPKRRIDEQTLLLGTAEISIERAIGAVLDRVNREARRIAGAVPEVVLTYPVGWGTRRRLILCAAAETAGLRVGGLVTEPISAAHYLVQVLGARIRSGRCVVIYDFGAGTFDATVMRRDAVGGFEVLASDGLHDAGGSDVDAAIVGYLGAALTGEASSAWSTLDGDDSAGGRRDRMRLWDQARTGKEALSRHSATFVHIPRVDRDMPLGREQLDRLAGPVLLRTIAATATALREARIDAQDVEAFLLVGGASRMPLAATLLHRRFGIAPASLEQPELVVAQGAVLSPVTPVPKNRPAPTAAPEANGRYTIRAIKPEIFSEARTIGEYFRDGDPVVVNVTGTEETAARRLVDFAAGLAFASHGTIEQLANRLFLLCPQNVVMSAEDRARMVDGGFFAPGPGTSGG